MISLRANQALPARWWPLLCGLLLTILSPPAQARPSGLDARNGHLQEVPGYAANSTPSGLSWGSPSERSPLGTILIGYIHEGKNPRLIEWDLAAAKRLRSIELGPLADAESVSVARRGRGVVVAASGDGGGRLIFLSPSLRPERTVMLKRARGVVVAASGVDTFAAWLDVADRQIVLARFDERGAEVARRTTPLIAGSGRNEWLPVGELQVLDGRLWLLASEDDGRLLLSASLDLQQLRRSELDTSSKLLGWAGRPALLSHEQGEVILQRLAPDFSIAERRALGPALDSDPPRGVYDAAHGLALDDGRIFDLAWAEHRTLRSPTSPRRLFWAQQRVVILSEHENSRHAYILWTE